MTDFISKARKLIKKHYELVSYLFFGGLTTVVSIAVYFIAARAFSMGAVPANVISWIVSVTFAYITNRIFVFRSRQKGFQQVAAEIVKFYSSRLASGIIETLLIFILVDMLGLYDMAIKLIVTVIVIILNYIFSKIIVFKK